MDKLSKADLRVIAAIREGCNTHPEIAERLGIKPQSVADRTWQIRQKLGGIKNFTALAILVTQEQEVDE